MYTNCCQNLQSADEMEEEERAAQAAKLQELIRRGGPEDLQEANRLMKVMAGYDTKHKTDYRAKAADEVGKIQQKAKLLEERLQNFKPGDSIAEGDVFEVLRFHRRHFKIVSGLTRRRTWQMLSKVLNPKFKRCVKKNPMIKRQLRSCLR